MKKDMPRKPFFVRLLETQEQEQVSVVRAGTLKYPSDSGDGHL